VTIRRRLLGAVSISYLEPRPLDSLRHAPCGIVVAIANNDQGLPAFQVHADTTHSVKRFEGCRDLLDTVVAAHAFDLDHPLGHRFVFRQIFFVSRQQEAAPTAPPIVVRRTVATMMACMQKLWPSVTN
jgi:hypothetical protein